MREIKRIGPGEGLSLDGRRPLCNLLLCLPLLLCRQMPFQTDVLMSQEGFITELGSLFGGGIFLGGLLLKGS